MIQSLITLVLFIIFAVTAIKATIAAVNEIQQMRKPQPTLQPAPVFVRTPREQIVRAYLVNGDGSKSYF